MRPSFRVVPGAALDDVQLEVRRALLEMGNFGIRELRNRTINTTETLIAHGMGSVPASWRITSQRGEGVVFETRRPDSQFLYLSVVHAPTGLVNIQGNGAAYSFRPDRYYPAGIGRVGPWAIARANPFVNPAGNLYAYPVEFDQFGTITDLAFDCQDSGIAVPHVWLYIYRDSTTARMVPGTLAYSANFTGAGVPGSQATLVASPNLSVVPGDVLHFGFIVDTNFAIPMACANGAIMQPTTGSDFVAHAAGTVGVYTYTIGYRHAFAFAAPPATFPGGGAPTMIVSTENPVPLVFFKFAAIPAGVPGLVLDSGAVTCDLELR